MKGSILFWPLLFAGLCTATAPRAQEARSVPMPPAIAAPADVPYPGTIVLSVDATDTERHIFRVQETIPVAGSGPMALLYPRWIPGYHRPSGRIDELTGLTISANGTRLPWTRDAADVHAFHIDVPAGAQSIDLEFQIVTPVNGSQGRVVITPDMLNLQWNTVALYPAGHYAGRITVEPRIILPPGWQAGTALEAASETDGTISYRPVTFDALVDSPVFAGQNFTRLDLDPGGAVPFYLNVVADETSNMAIEDAHLETHRNLVQQAYRLFQSRHFDRYDFLLALSDNLSGIGLEHLSSSENGVPSGYFTEWDQSTDIRDLLPHELAHSWNGKFRRPADLWIPNFNVPMRDSLLWVYEGQTQYWGFILAARSGLWSQQEALDEIAWTAATYAHRAGRAWRPLQDTTNDPIAAARRPIPWRSWQRSEDYYSEGQLIWLDADTLIRELSGGQKSLDDFAAAFFGIEDGSSDVRTYTFDDIVAALNGVQPHDWTEFLRSRLDGIDGGAPLDGIARGGYRLVYTESPTDYFKSSESRRGATDLTFSLGMSIGRNGALSDVLWEGPAYDAGLTVGTELVAVSGMEFTGERIKDAITRSKDTTVPVELIVKNGERFRTVQIDYRGGLRYPRLERVEDTPARLDAILAPRP